MRAFRLIAFLCSLLTMHGWAQADTHTNSRIQVIDDFGQMISLDQPAQRIISLAPHTTEMLFSAGAGDKLVGAVAYSDYPAAAKAIPRIGSYQQLDFEQIVALKPDLIVGWASGNPAGALERLQKFGFEVYLSEPGELEAIASNIERLSQLAGTAAAAAGEIRAFREGINKLREQYREAAPVSLFYEIWNDPLMTLNGEHIFSDVVEVCGGRNVFADLPNLAPRVSVEAVLEEDPQVIIASGSGEDRPQWLDEWNKWPHLQAVKNNHIFVIPPDIIQRHSVRILQGAEMLCEQLERVRGGFPGGKGKSADHKGAHLGAPLRGVGH